MNTCCDSWTRNPSWTSTCGLGRGRARRWLFPSPRRRQNPRRDGDLRERRSVGTPRTREERTASDVDLFRALGFLTILPCPRQESSPEDLGRSSGWFPAVGAVLGAILAVLARAVRSAFSPCGLFCRRGPLGVADPGFPPGRPGGHLRRHRGRGYSRESRLTAIMKDSRLGTFGGIAVAATLLLKTAVLADITGISGSAALCLLPCRRKMGDPLRYEIFPFQPAPRRMGDTCQRVHRAPACYRNRDRRTGRTLCRRDCRGGVARGRTLCRRRNAISISVDQPLGGLTGDSYGAICEISEILSLFLFCPSSIGKTTGKMIFLFPGLLSSFPHVFPLPHWKIFLSHNISCKIASKILKYRCEYLVYLTGGPEVDICSGMAVSFEGDDGETRFLVHSEADTVER